MKGVVIRQGEIPAFLWAASSASLEDQRTDHLQPMAPENPQRPAWLNWLFLLAFLWSSYQLAGFWFQRLHS